MTKKVVTKDTVAAGQLIANPAAGAVAAQLEGSLPDITAMTPTQIAAVVLKADEISKWLTSVKELALTMSLKGEDVPGTKLVAGRSSRHFGSDEKTVAKEIRQRLKGKVDDVDEVLYAEPSMRTVAQMEKELGKETFKLISDLVVTSNGKATLVDLADKRPALAIESVKSQFANEKEDEEVDTGY